MPRLDALRVRHRLNEFPIVVFLVAAGQGVALLSRYMGNPDARPGVVLRPLAGIETGRQIDILSRPEVLRKESVITVIAAIRDVLRVPASERLPGAGQVGYCEEYRRIMSTGPILSLDRVNGYVVG